MQTYIIPLSGNIIIENERINGERIIDLAEQGILYGVVSRNSQTGCWIASFEAENDSDVMILPPNFLSLSNKYGQKHILIAENLIAMVGKVAFWLNFRLNIFSFKSIRGKIAYYLVRQSEMSSSPLFNLPFNRNEMAEFLNVSRPSLSRELAKMKVDGLIDYYKNTISIKNTCGLSVFMET